MARLPILMYHNVSKSEEFSKGLTISISKLEEQFQYLKKKGYTTFHFSELENLKKIPSKSVVLTFDDVTVNQLEFAVPLLKKYDLKATFFIPFQYIGESDLWNSGEESIMTAEMLKQLDPLIELGLHSFAHRKYSNLSEEEIKLDCDKCYESINQHDLKVYPALAYPYGNFPKKKPQRSDFQKLLEDNNVKMGLRIGNRLNKFPFKNKYEINRIDIKGEDNLIQFKLKLRFGKLKLF